MKRYFEIIATNGQRSLVVVEKPITTKLELGREAQRQGILPPDVLISKHRELSEVEYNLMELENA